jgi:hypothetical protein
MIDREQIFTTIEAGLAFAHTSIIVRVRGAIAEIRGPLKLRQGKEWLTIGEEAGSHAHVKIEDVCAVRFCQSTAANAALEILDSEGMVLCRISFRCTNPERTESYSADHAESVRARFSHLTEAMEVRERANG